MTVGTQAERELRDLVDERVWAVRTKDPAPLAARMSPDVLEFGVVGPISVRGGGAAAEVTQAWFDGYAGDIGYVVSDLEVDAEGDLGWCAFTYRVTGTLRTGGEIDMRVRATLVCRRTDVDGTPTWRIVHDHESAPLELPAD